MKRQILVLCGGQSTEHDISIISAKNVTKGLDTERYEVTVAYIDHQGAWFVMPAAMLLAQSPPVAVAQGLAKPVALVPGGGRQLLVTLDAAQARVDVDCVFPILHGTLGEDGAPQGLCDMLNVPYVGAGVLGSAVAMDKHTTKCLLRFAGLPTADWQMFYQHQAAEYSYDRLVAELGDILFVKPVSLGSSVGIAKVRNAAEYQAALVEVFQYDNRVLVERFITGREIECSVLGNELPHASLPGEVVTSHDFYSYAAKYEDPEGANIITPAQLPEEMVSRIQALSVAAFQVLQCEGMARVDCFVQDDDILINEVNTIPGFTDISLYPKNWAVSGLAYTALLDQLIELAITRFAKHQQLERKYQQLSLSTDSSVE